MSNEESIMIDESGEPHEEIQVHEHGFVKLLDVMGDDEEVENAARISYGEGTRKTSQTRNLIRYLMRHKHTSPFEMCEVKFHLKLPIFVMRQLVRHRTANLNEYSGRYSVMSDDFYFIGHFSTLLLSNPLLIPSSFLYLSFQEFHQLTTH